MLFRRKTYKLHPGKRTEFDRFFHTYLYPNQIKHGARLVGRWVNEAEDEVFAIWQYDSMEHYEKIEQEIRSSELHQQAQGIRTSLGALYSESKQDFWTSTAEPETYHPPKHIVAVSGYITNETGEVLLVRNLHRSDTMEQPGGMVEEGESLEEAVIREIFEETGITVKVFGVTGVYQNMTSGGICVMFRGEYASGQLQTAEGETTEAAFAQITEENLEDYITRPHLRVRLLDARNSRCVPYEAFRVRPYDLIRRLEE